MAQPKTHRMYVQRIVVTGSGRFPTDMLRYDGCVPYHEEDALTIERFNGLRSVTLKRYTPVADDPCIERWASFGWTVREHNFISPSH